MQNFVYFQVMIPISRGFDKLKKAFIFSEICVESAKRPKTTPVWPLRFPQTCGMQSAYFAGRIGDCRELVIVKITKFTTKIARIPQKSSELVIGIAESPIPELLGIPEWHTSGRKCFRSDRVW